MKKLLKLILLLIALVILIAVVLMFQSFGLKTLQETVTQTLTTANWKTFRSEEKGFELRYPPDWKEIRDPSEEYLVVSVSPNDKPQSTSEILPLLGVFVEPLEETHGFIDSYISNNSTEIKVDGVLGYEFKQVLGDTVQIVISVQKETYVYSFQFYYKKDFNGDEEIFRRILSTFKFLK